MGPWDVLIDEREVAAILPGPYARYRRALAGALGVFLEHLEPARRAALLAQQACQPAAGAAQRLAMLARGCPVLQKLGQVLARDRRLSLELRLHLQQLESMPPQVELASVRQALVEELGPLDRLPVRLGDRALAEASVAVVLPYIDLRVKSAAQRDGVFKVLKPGIEARLQRELEILDLVGAYLDDRCDDLGLPALDYRDSFRQVREKLEHEVRLDQEQVHLASAERVYRNESGVRIPGLREFCTPRVTAMERIAGTKPTDPGIPPVERRRLADTLVRTVIGCAVFSSAEGALFHADPHAGNLLQTPDGRLAILDWSLAGMLGREARAALMRLVLGGMTLQAGVVLESLLGLSSHPVADRAALERLVAAHLSQLGRSVQPGLGWAVGLLDEAAQAARLRTAGDLILFRKTLHMLQGVVADLNSDTRRMDAILLGRGASCLAAEWPFRWLARPDEPSPITRLSGRDLWHAALAMPSAAAVLWLRQTAFLQPSAASEG